MEEERLHTAQWDPERLDESVRPHDVTQPSRRGYSSSSLPYSPFTAQHHRTVPSSRFEEPDDQSRHGSHQQRDIQQERYGFRPWTASDDWLPDSTQGESSQYYPQRLKFGSIRQPFDEREGYRTNDRNDDVLRRAHLVEAQEQAQEAPPPRLSSHILLDPNLEPRTFNLIIRQAPIHGQLCTLGSKDRRILDPLPIIELDMRDRYGRKDIVGLATPFLLMQVDLIADDLRMSGFASSSRNIQDKQEASNSDFAEAQEGSMADLGSAARLHHSKSLGDKIHLPSPSRISQTTSSRLRHHSTPSLRLLEGKLTASAQIARDLKNSFQNTRRRGDDDAAFGKGEMSDERACFFAFTDLSVRMRGTFRLHFSLVRLGNPSHLQTLSHRSGLAGAVVCQAISAPFEVVHARDFAGMTESTPLAKCLAGQGIHIPIRNEARGRSRGSQLERTNLSTPDLDEGI